MEIDEVYKVVGKLYLDSVLGLEKLRKEIESLQRELRALRSERGD